MKKWIISFYSVFLIAFIFYSYLFIDFNLSYLNRFYSNFIFDNRQLTSIMYASFICTFFVFYFLFWRMYLNNTLGKKDIKWIIGMTSLTLLISYPAMLSYDIFNYVLTAKVLYLYKENPYIIMPMQFTGDPFLAFTHAANKIALYGPTWLGITSIPHFLGFGNFILILFNFKLLAAAFYAATAWMLYKISKDFLSVVIFSLNPLVIIETLVSGHNDIAVVFFALSGLYLLSKKKILLAFILLLLSILIKYSTLLLLPVFLYVVFLRIKNKTVNWDKIYAICAILMLTAFLLAPFREEIYPWYAIWFLPFVALLRRKSMMVVSLVFSFSLLLRYIPYMLLGTHLDPSPLIKTLVTFVPVTCVLMFMFVKNKLWEKRFFRF
ncbi:MAG: hypothetical protein WD992_03175 [Candidatus Levyibacteriota bacterium]